MKKSKAPTLADELYELTHTKAWPDIWRNPELLRQKLFQARRFVLDDEMSAFLADLSLAAYLPKKPTPLLSVKKPRHKILTEQLRIGARLPHRVTWVEYNLQACLKRSNELRGTTFNPGEAPEKEGWLFEDHDETVFASLFSSTKEESSDGFDHWSFPWTYIWSYTDKHLKIPIVNVGGTRMSLQDIFDAYFKDKTVTARFPGESKSRYATVSEIATGLIGYKSSHVDIGPCQFSRSFKNAKELTGYIDLLNEWSGTMRRMWSFLATINDIPVLRREVKASKGFMARGSYKRFLDHHTITLHVPIKKDLRILARSVVAAARRRAHMVRGHWRVDWHYPPSPLCHHEWTVDKICKNCSGHRLWIPEHQRGDASLGVVMTDYQVEHSR